MSGPAQARAPGFLQHLLLLWGLRLAIGFNGKRQSRALAVLAFAASSAPGLTLGLGFYWLMRLQFVSTQPAWEAFILNILCFVTAAVWCTWPILSAGVDDHSELSRYAAYPITPFRLMIASTLASLLEPRAIFFYSPVVGAALGYASVHPMARPWLGVLSFVAFVLLNATWSRVGLHLVLNVLRNERNAELIGGGFVLLLVGASFIPPIDVSWLYAVAGDAGAMDLTVLVNAALALSRVPPGFFGDSLIALSHGRVRTAVADLVGTLLFSGLGLYLAHRLLLRFYHRVGRSGPSPRGRSRNPFATTPTQFRTLVMREALDLWNNPRARLLASVPFLLAILLKLLSGRELFVYLLGASADAWVMGGLCLYGAVVIASTFSQNMFAYDGHGLAAILAAPVELGQVLRAKNRVHAGAAAGLALLVAAFYRLYFGQGSLWDLACALAGVASLLPVLLTAGNFLSLAFPTRFHASLKRRDKLPFAASMLGVAAASLGALPWVWALRLEGKDGTDARTFLTVSLCGALAWMIYRASLPRAESLLVARREKVLQAVTRD